MSNALKVNKRMKRLVLTLYDYLDDYGYYDDDLGETVICGTEEECYNFIMLDNDFHLLTSEFVKHCIHLLFTDWDAFVHLDYVCNKC